MRLRLEAVIPAVMLVFLSVAPVMADAPPEWLQVEGSLYDILLQRPPGSHVRATAVVVDKVRSHNSPPYFTVREMFAPSYKVAILATPSPLLRLGMVIDVVGTVTALDGGGVALENVTVFGYKDGESGALLVDSGPLKGPSAFIPWNDGDMVDLTVPSTSGLESLTTASAFDSFSCEEPNTDSLPSPTYFSDIASLLAASAEPQQSSGTRMMSTQTSYNGIGDITGSDGDPVALECKAITEVASDGSYFVATDTSGSISVFCTAARLTDVTTNDRASKIKGQLRHLNDDPIICIDAGPDYDPNAVANPLLQITKAGRLSWAKSFEDGNLLPLPLTGKIVVADRSDFTNNTLYIEEPDRSGGIRVHYTGTADAVRDAVADVTGTITTNTDGERYIDVGTDGSLTVTASDSPLATLGLVNQAIGGGSFNALTPGVSTWNGTGYVPATETHNLGLLVTSWGTVTGVYGSEKSFYVSDGSNLDDGTSHAKGLKVSWAEQNTSSHTEITPPSAGRYVRVTGISSAESVNGGTIIRILRPRTQGDILQFPDELPPLVVITFPDASPNKATGGLVPISGTASDTQTGIASVQVKYDSGDWETAAYDADSSTWSYAGWDLSAGTHTISAKAIDNANNSTTVTEEIDVTEITELDYFSSLVTYCQQ